MVDSPNHRELVKAIALGDTGKAHELNLVIPDSERAQYHEYVTAFFSVLLEHRFADDSSRDTIATFVNEMRHDYRNTEAPINALIIEGVIRASCGEEYFLDNISGAETLRAEYLVIGKIATQSPTVFPRIEEFLDKAEHLMQEWTAEE